MYVGITTVEQIEDLIGIYGTLQTIADNAIIKVDTAPNQEYSNQTAFGIFGGLVYNIHSNGRQVTIDPDLTPKNLIAELAEKVSPITQKEREDNRLNPGKLEKLAYCNAVSPLLKVALYPQLPENAETGIYIPVRQITSIKELK